MRKLISSVVAIIALVSCTSTEPKMITPSSTEFESGKFADYFKLSDQSAELSFIEITYDDVEFYPVLMLTTTLEQIKERTGGKPSDNIEFDDFEAIINLNLTDAEGNVITDMHLDSDYSYAVAEALLNGAKGDNIEVMFVKSFSSKKEAAEVLKQVSQFHPTSTCGINPFGLAVKTDWRTHSSWYKDRYIIEIHADGTLEMNIQMNIKGSGVINNEYIGTWTIGDYQRGNNWIEYYDITIIKDNGYELEFYLPKTLDYAYDDWSYMSGGNTNLGYKVLSAEDVYIAL